MPHPTGQHAAIFSRGIQRIPHLKVFLGADRIIFRPTAQQAGGISAVYGWGNKANTAQAQRYAAKHKLPYLRLEDGFLRSAGLGIHGAPPLSLVVDDLGIHYDARQPSRLECLLNQQGPNDPLASPILQQRARHCMQDIVQNRLSKYNHAPVSGPLPAPSERPVVLLIDQTFGDLAIQHGMLHAKGFSGMLHTAMADHPDADIWIKTHPDVISGKKRGYLGKPPVSSRIQLLATEVAPLSLLARVDCVYTATSLMGFEALLMNKPVHCFGAPFYAGWGLTHDHVALPRRQAKRSLAELFAAAYLLYARYVDPDRGQPCELERIIEHLSLQRRMAQHNQGHFYCWGFSLWKQRFVKGFLQASDNHIHFVKRLPARLPAHSRLVVWGHKTPAWLEQWVRNTQTPLIRMEDGFLRSAGLGSDLAHPLSWVVDQHGIYYDPNSGSDLERILQTKPFHSHLLNQARTLRQQLQQQRISKYNVGKTDRLLHEAQPGQTIILVPGQVEDDASIRYGSPQIKSNVALLRTVRDCHPDAYIIYKPHPDLVSGNRGHIHRQQPTETYDQQVTDLDIITCIQAIDEVHTMTSLCGFEALLHQRTVHTYGQPFYAGWGLTQDHCPVPHRQRQLTLDELIAGTLLCYPRYINWQHGHFTTAPAIIRILTAQRSCRAINSPWWQRQLDKLIHLWQALR